MSYTWVNTIHGQAKKNAKARGIAFDLTMKDMHKLEKRAKGCCELSGIVFEFGSESSGNGSRRPFAPSLDRIDSRAGYTYENCRIVCVLANIAMNTWGENPLIRFCTAVCENESDEIDEYNRQVDIRRRQYKRNYLARHLNAEFSETFITNLLNLGIGTLRTARLEGTAPSFTLAVNGKGRYYRLSDVLSWAEKYDIPTKLSVIYPYDPAYRYKKRPDMHEESAKYELSELRLEVEKLRKYKEYNKNYYSLYRVLLRQLHEALNRHTVASEHDVPDSTY